jgi:hypothetical protein
LKYYLASSRPDGLDGSEWGLIASMAKAYGKAIPSYPIPQEQDKYLPIFPNLSGMPMVNWSRVTHVFQASPKRRLERIPLPLPR